MNDFSKEHTPPDPIELRKGIRLPGVSIEWTSNLTDGQLWDVYRRLVQKGVVSEAMGDGGPGFHLGFHTLEYLDGACIISVLTGYITVVYRSIEQWERHMAHTKRIEEKTDRVNRSYRRMVEEACARWNAGDLAGAERVLLTATALREENEDFQRQTSPHLFLMDIYARDEDPSRGLAYLEQYGHPWHEYTAFAQRYGWKKCDQAFQIYRRAIELFPDQWPVYKEFALLAAGGPARPDLAIWVCEEAARRGLNDDTASGFQGRAKRIRKKYNRR